LCFWEASDNFTFEKSFSVGNHAADYQTNIWYIEFLDLWITTDKTQCINGWDLLNESKAFCLTSPKLKSSIVDIIEIDVLKLVVISTMDKMITIWDFSKRVCVSHIDLTQGGIHTMIWSNTYQILITAGYQNTIKLWDLNPEYLDHALIGRLIGHPCMVTAVEAVDKTPMVISADDGGNIKVWDIRNLNCLQTVELGSRIMINRIISIYEDDRICIVGSRISFLMFDEPIESTAKAKMEEKVWPIKTEYNFNLNELVVCTSKDVRFLDASTGRTKKIYTGLLNDDDENSDICAFKLIQQNKKFILGDNRGNLGLYLYATGELLKPLHHHNHEITNIKYDYINKLIISSSADSTVAIQKEEKRKFEVKRKIRNMHYQKDVTLLAVSVHHNIFLTATNTKTIYVWDYEYAKLVAKLELEDDVEPTCLQFINGFGIIILADSLSRVHFIKFSRKDITFEFHKIGVIELHTDLGSLSSNSRIPKSQSTYVNKILLDIEYEKETSSLVKKCQLYVATNKGDVIGYNIIDLFKVHKLELVEHANKRINYNPERSADEDFMTSINNQKVVVFFPGTFESNTIDFSEKISVKFKAHKELLTTLSFMVSGEKRILTSSQDYYIKIWKLSGELMGALNINHPLPTRWDMTFDLTNYHKSKILYSLKVIENIYKRHGNNMLFTEEKKININQFLKALGGERSTFLITQNENEEPPKKKKEILLMKDQFDPRDFQYESLKSIYQNEIQGPSLKQMEITKRMMIAQKNWREQIRKIDERETLLHNIAAEKGYDDREKVEFMNFLLGDNKLKIEDQMQVSKFTRSLEAKMEILLKKNEKKRRQEMNKKQLVPKESSTLAKGAHMIIQGNRATNAFKIRRPSADTSRDKIDDEPSPLDSKMRSKPTLESPRSHILERTGSTDSIKGSKLKYKPSPMGITQVKSRLDLDFYSYASQRFGSEDERLSMISTKNPSEASVKHTQTYDRKLHQRDFQEIIKKLDLNLKKSQMSGTIYKWVGSVPFRTTSIAMSVVSSPRQSGKGLGRISLPSISTDIDPKLLSPGNGATSVHQRTKSVSTFVSPKSVKETKTMRDTMQNRWSLTQYSGFKPDEISKPIDTLTVNTSTLSPVLDLSQETGSMNFSYYDQLFKKQNETPTNQNFFKTKLTTLHTKSKSESKITSMKFNLNTRK